MKPASLQIGIIHMCTTDNLNLTLKTRECSKLNLFLLSAKLKRRGRTGVLYSALQMKESACWERAHTIYSAGPPWGRGTESVQHKNQTFQTKISDKVDAEEWEFKKCNIGIELQQRCIQGERSAHSNSEFHTAIVNCTQQWWTAHTYSSPGIPGSRTARHFTSHIWIQLFLWPSFGC